MHADLMKKSQSMEPCPAQAHPFCGLKGDETANTGTDTHTHRESSVCQCMPKTAKRLWSKKLNQWIDLEQAVHVGLQ